ncbi:hypothetical protein [Limimaricola pyoseonensis]|uniref:Uncharacterized protein n=1 Tax=Limimaricola pyoseonensis TaxID=521013 RepID=A0A1G7D1Q1_9RHOB|nr:hypothetical protein [Limimaricola pyoseonensis]SDE45441.1 hypothetical protein SAMN04488567_1746 [Limimaricola pyoseonensis]
MIRLLSTAALLALLAGCGDGQPFDFEDPADAPADGGDAGGRDSGGDAEDGDDADDGFGGDERLLPGTADPDPDRSITRFEAETEDGGGFVRRVTLLSGARLEVDNLAFDGTEPYRSDYRGPSTLNGYAVFQSAAEVETGGSEPIDQLDYRAIYGESINTVRVDGERLPRTRFAVVRTGDFSNFGFGGFLYERNGGVEIPARGQAAFRGDYAGIRVFDTISRHEFTTGDIEVLVDFDDFNASDGVRGTLSNRRAFDEDGLEIETNTSGVRRTDLSDRAILDLPTVRFVLTDAASTPNGEIVGQLNNLVVVDGKAEPYEAGEYFGVLSGDLETGGEVTGILVFESEDPRLEDIRVQETGGFTAYRD